MVVVVTPGSDLSVVAWTTSRHRICGSGLPEAAVVISEEPVMAQNPSELITVGMLKRHFA